MLSLSAYGIQLSPKAYLVLAALLGAAGLYIIINPKAFLRWGRGRSYSGWEPEKSQLLAARIVGAAILLMCVLGYLSLGQQ